MTDWPPPPLQRVLAGTPEFAEACLVGGCVRDRLLGIPSKDFDIEVFGLDYGRLVSALRRWGRVDVVGRSFGVAKLTVAPGETYDFTLPRRDSKVAQGHRGFDVAFDPGLQPRDAAARRDFTINAMMWHVRRGELLDFFGGEADLRARVLRHTSPAFDEDPLRVVRGLQFAGRFRLTGAPETLALCRGIAHRHGELAVERIREEWFKWSERSALPSAGLRWLRDSGWLVHYSELEALIGVPQDPEWHPEGDVWTHTLHCLDALATLPGWRNGDATRRRILVFAVLCHDFAKPGCTREESREGRMRIVSPGHEPAGGPLARAFLARLQAPEGLVNQVLPLVVNHLAHLQEPSERGVRRLAARLAPATLEDLMTVITADAFGRPPRPREEPSGLAHLRARANQLKVATMAPRPLLLGRHLLEHHLRPGPEFSRILNAAFAAQLDGEFGDLDGAKRWLTGWLSGSR
ncbi:MAG: polynucleotide adenylyltransferase [Verrucomicrobiae bacterium]|nr:polynucleotide adenylyltransferase [Verrucomicrobiae bacterium]